MRRFLMLLVAAGVGLWLGGGAPAAQAGKGPQVQVHECVYAAHGSAADKARYAKPPGTPGNGPGGGGGGGKGPECGKTFGAWKNVTTLNVYVDGTGGPIAESDFVAYVHYAFDEWDCASGIGEAITINYVASAAGADITVGWGNLGTTGILGQAYTPTQGKRILSSAITMNSNQSVFTWTLGPTPVFTGGCVEEVANGDTTTSNYDLFSVLLHEVGHALGLNHPNRNCIDTDPCYPESMYSCTDAEEFMRRTPEAGDIGAITSLYGP